MASYVDHFPDLSFLLVESEAGSPKLYSIVRNKDHYNSAWVLAEEFRRNKSKDTLLIYDGVAGPYPNMFFRIKASQLRSFSSSLQRVRSDEDWQKFMATFGIDRKHPEFWSTYDQINKYSQSKLPLSGGIIDLLRFGYEK